MALKIVNENRDEFERIWDEYLHVKLEDDRIISTPIDWYAPLKKATLSQLKEYKFICLNTGIEWESIDYHLNIESMLEVSLTKVA